MLLALQRYGGFLTAPRTTVSALPAGVGARDGFTLIVAYLAGTHLQPLAESVAGVIAMQNFSGLLMLANGIARAVLPPIVVLVLCEVLLGRGKSHRRGLCLVPFVAVTVAAHSLWLAGVHLPGPGYLPMLLGAVAAAATALYVRPAVAPEAEEAAPA